MASKIKALQQWCQKMAEGYPGVNISNFTTAWRDGLAFSAIIHKFRPDLIDFDSLSSENVFENCKMAFEIAEKELSIPAFLEAEDMVRLKVPDKLSIITYVSQYYNYLHSLPQLGGPGVKSKVSGKTISGMKRPPDSDTTQAPITKKATIVETKENAAPAKVAATAGSEKCGICHEHVYLIERHMEEGKLYHRSCFRRSELSPANKVYTRSPFMSPALSSEAQQLAVSKADNKSSILTNADRDGKVTNLQRHVDNQPMKTEFDTKVSKKLDFAGSKHPIDEPGREDAKKSKMQPRNLFDDEKSKKISVEKDKSAEYSSKKISESNKLLPFSSKEAHKMEKTQEAILASEKALTEKSGNTKVNKSVFFQQKNNATQDILTPAAASVPTKSKSETKSGNIAAASKISIATLSFQPHSESAQSKNKHTVGKESQKLSEEGKLSLGKNIQKLSESAQSENKHTDGKGSQKLLEEAEKSTIGKSIQKPSEQKNQDAVPSKSNLLPDVHNRQKLFTGQPSSDSSEAMTPVYPRAKPRTSALLEDQEHRKDAVATKPDETSAPKPVPRKNIFSTSGITSVPKQPEMSAGQMKKSSLETESSGKPEASKPLAPGVSLSVSRNDPPQLFTSATSSPFDKNYKTPSVNRTLTETKVSFTAVINSDEPRNVPLTNQSHILHQKIDANKAIGQHSLDVKSANKSGNASVLNFPNVTKQTEVGSAAMTGTRSNQKWSIDKEQTPLSIASTRKDNSTGSTTGLSTTTPNSTVRTTLAPTKLQLSTPLPQTESDSKFISSSRNTTNKTVNATPTSYTGTSVSQTQTVHISVDVKNPTKVITNTSGIQSTKNIEKSVVTQVSKDSPISAKTVVSTPRLQTTNKVQEASSVFSSAKPTSSETGTTFTSNSTKGDVNLTKPQKVNDSSSKPALSHSKEKATPDVPSGNINQNRQAQAASSNLLNLKDSEQKSAVKNGKADSKPTDNHGSKGLSSVKNSAISGSKEDILDINNVKLKRVMPEQKEIQNEHKTNMYDVKLKKVDAIKGDTRWDSSQQKPSKSIDVSKTVLEHKTADAHIYSSGDIKDHLSSSKGIDPKAAALSAVVSNSNTATSEKSISEMPQWKKDAEERQRKLRGNVVNTEQKTDNEKHLKHHSDNSTPLKSDNKAGLANIGKATKIENVSVGAPSLLKTPSQTVPSEREPLATQKYGNKLLPTPDDPGVVKKLDWQLEAEKRMAAIAKFDTRVAGKIKEVDKSNTASSDSSGNQQAKKSTASHEIDVSQQVKKNSAVHKTDASKDKDNTRLNGETVAGKHSILKDKTTASMLDKSVAKSKETELKTTVNKMQLASVPETSTLPGKEIEQSSNTKQTNGGETDDFRQVLHQLKHVTTADSERIDSVQPGSETHVHHEQTTKDIHTTTTHKAIANNNTNKNNNKQSVSEKSHISDKDNIKVFNKNTYLSVKTPDLEYLADENGNVRKDNTFEESEKKHNVGKVSRVAEKENTTYTSPKMKRKLSIHDNKVSEMPTPSSPTQRKKIQVPSKFDFEKSSDFEQSLALSTAKLTIRENPTPEKSMSSPPGQEQLSPQHISAIELQQQLRNIDTRLTDLELKGRDLEESIRKVNTMDEDDDKLMIEWFMLINEKNDLVRQEADLIYISKEQELEDEQEQIEAQLHYLITKPDECKSPEEKEEEDYLIHRKVALVEQRNKIIDSMDEDRIRYEAEDKNIEVTLKDKGYWKDSTGTLKALKGKKVANSMFYA